ncbi:hypothetical protein AB0N81_26445 [Streptomyces sp. NPDC093510]|uniref:hypothetical protein n=1 Tax=Streptomyces sp. NPDC093510 TaxID=3155199 RepID=UPI003415AD5D
MGGSTRKTRRRAAGPALRYAHVPGARPSPGSKERAKGRVKGRAENRGEKGTWGERLFGVLMTLLVLAVVVLFVLADMAWGETLWGELAPAWPGGGYGFAITVGLLVPPAVAAIVAPLMRADWKKEKARSLAWTAAALPGVALTCLLVLTSLSAARPKRRRRGPSCYSQGEPCWVHEQYPYLWLPGIAAAVLSLAAGGWLFHVYVKRRRAAPTPPAPTPPTLTPPGTAAP